MRLSSLIIALILYPAALATSSAMLGAHSS
jgi:hypothetical protein